jgi:uncharacterized OB-fold protein
MTTQKPPAKVPRPVPETDEAWAPFFDAAKRGELMVRRCKGCGAWLGIDKTICPECLGDRVEWAKASGKGTLFTFGLMHQRYHPGFESEIPYNIAVVELAEGPRFNTNIVGCANKDLRVGMAVEVTFEKVSDKVTVPNFKPAAKK